MAKPKSREKTTSPLLLHLTGTPGSGKSTFARLLFETLIHTSILAVDPSREGFLALSYGMPTSTTLADMLNRFAERLEKTGVPILSGESVDWVFNDLPVAIGSRADTDVLSLGVFPKPLSLDVQQTVRYGLPRLFSHYELVVWDGPMGAPEPVFSFMDDETLMPQRAVWIVTPDESPAVLAQQFEAMRRTLRSTIYVVYSKAEASAPWPEALMEPMRAGQLRFIGKLPPVDKDHVGLSALNQLACECLYKLDLPFELQDRLQP
ncbi:MAG: hypothetical protein R2857_05330 [Vampirovibrionales bacterium]|nr:hypothetical protein [Cyanobacteria bacterium HKST-UBA03]